MDLPIFKLIVTEEQEDGVDLVSMVDEPAIEEPFQLFSKAKQQFNIEDEEQRIVSGPLLVTNKPIYRDNAQYGEHYVVFEKDTVRTIMQKFFKNNYHLQANFNHDQSETIEDVFFYESFMIDSDRGIKCPDGYDLPDGSWFGTLKIECNKTWEKVKDGEFNGFSVEGIFGYESFEKEQSVEQLCNDIDELIEDLRT